MQFGNLTYFWILILVPTIVGIGILRHKRRKIKLLKFAESPLLEKIYPDYLTFPKNDRRYTIVLAILTLLLCLSALRPQWGFTWKESRRSGVDIAVAVDVSESMLAEDVSPNRLERARRELLDLVSELQGDRVALISFAGVAFIEMPLTLDYGAFRMFLNTLKPDLIPIKGTNITAALSKSLEALGVYRDAKLGVTSKRSRAIILITDGEEFEGDFKEIAKTATENRVRIYILGVGTVEGGPINTANGYKKDKSGQVVISRLNENALAELATATSGIYVKSISSDMDTHTIYKEGIKKALIDSSLTWKNSKRWNEYFQIPLFVAILFLAVGIWGNFNIKRRKQITGLPLLALPLALLSLLLPINAYADLLPESAESLAEQAKRSYEQGDFKTSLEAFQKARTKSAEDYRFLIGEAANYYRLNDFNNAQSKFFEAAAKTEDKQAKASALYNAANSYVQLGNYQEAIKTYEQSLSLRPDDREAKDNLAYAKRLLEEQKKQKQENKQNQQQQKQEQNSSEDKQSQEQKQDSEQKDSEEKKENSSESKQQEQQNQSQENQEQKEQNEPEQNQKQNQQQNQQQDQSAENNSEQSQEDSPQPEETKAGGEKNEPKQEKPEKNQSAGGNQTDSELQSGDESKEPLDARIGSIEEKQDSRLKYRAAQGMKQLKEQNLQIPKKDW